MHTFIGVCSRLMLEYIFRYSFLITKKKKKILPLERESMKRQHHPSGSVFGKLSLNQPKTG